MRIWLITEKVLNRNGLTLSELMIASLILAVVLSALLGIFGNLIALNETNQNFTIASLHAQTVMDRIKNTARYDQIESNINSNDWDLDATALSASPYNFILLSNESIDTAVVQSGNPLMISITVSWNERGQRPLSFELRSMLTY